MKEKKKEAKKKVEINKGISRARVSARESETKGNDSGISRLITAFYKFAKHRFFKINFVIIFLTLKMAVNEIIRYSFQMLNLIDHGMEKNTRVGIIYRCIINRLNILGPP